MKDYGAETSSSLSLYSSTDATCTSTSSAHTCTSTSSAYTVTRSFDSLCAEDMDSYAVVGADSSEHCSDSHSHTNSSSTLKPRRGFDSSAVKGSCDSLCTNNDSDSSYVCMDRRRGPCLGVETKSDSRCSSSETVFRSDSSCNTVRRSFDSLCVTDDSEAVYVCMDGRGGSDASYSSADTARDSDSSLYSVERSLDSPYLSERAVALCTCPLETEASQASTERSVDSLYLSDNTTALCTCPTEMKSSQASTERSSDSLYLSEKTTALCTYPVKTEPCPTSTERSTDSLYLSHNTTALCTCPVELEASQSSVEVYPNLYCSETDNGATSVVTSAVTSDPSVCDSSYGVDSDSLSTSAVAEWGSVVSLDNSERSVSESTPGHRGNSSDSLYQAAADTPASSPGNGAERDAADALARTLEAGMQLDSPAHLASHLERVLKDLRGAVTQADRRLVSPFFRELVRETGDDRDQKTSTNEGFLFHPQKLLQPRHLAYREGQQYSLLQHIQNGSYGDVFSAVDLTTGFKCAAKKVPLCSFSWEEVGTWSGLSSPRVLQLFGAVREGPNIVLFMDLKTGSLAQLLRCRGRLPEDLSLHYHVQVLEALEHLHRRRVLHLDVKVDNVLLSEDGRDCFLCDFGLSEMLDTNGQAPRAFRGYGLRGTETHMAPEVARGDVRGAKADVWSSCCMLLHMLNGCHPWTRYYAHPLCLTIVSEEAPLREVPSSCRPLTVQVFRAGLVKDPGERASAMELKERSRDALRAVGGVSSTITHPPTHPPVEPSAETKSTPAPERPSGTPQEAPPPPPRGYDIASCCGDSPQPLVHWLSTWRERAQEEEGSESEGGERHSEEEEEEWSEAEGRREKWEEEESEEEEDGSDLESLRGKASDWMEEEEEWEPFHRLQILYGPKHHTHSHTHSHAHSHSHTDQTESEEEAPMKGPSLNSVSLPRPPRSQNRALIPRNTSEHQYDSSEKESDDWSDDLSSGVFSSYNSQTDRESFSVDWLVSTNQPPSCCIEGLGVDIWIEDFSGERFRIREKPQVKVGHVAMGISDQISLRMFSLATLDGKLVQPEEEVQESGTWLQCVPALDDCPAWTWRIRDGQLEERR
ncbi:mitogen-activated protein kinase kinase kinase 14 [Sardina pilchardus]|uniref:mitogen-activated protein kinase kinase kinase 14 n=1 Tax=Sardina pilchardus TaxID=27697 RepID=UPI002E13F4EB